MFRDLHELTLERQLRHDPVVPARIARHQAGSPERVGPDHPEGCVDELFGTDRVQQATRRIVRDEIPSWIVEIQRGVIPVDEIGLRVGEDDGRISIDGLDAAFEVALPEDVVGRRPFE